MLNERLLAILSTKENVNLYMLGFEDESVKEYKALITPVEIAGERLGSLLIYRKGKEYDIDDIILSEYGTTVVGLEMLRSVTEENAEEARKVQVVRSIHFHFPNWRLSSTSLKNSAAQKVFW